MEINNVDAMVHFENSWVVGYINPVVIEWKKRDFNAEYFEEFVYPILNNIRTFQVDEKGISFSTMDPNEWFLANDLNTDKLIESIPNPVIKAEVRRRYNY